MKLHFELISENTLLGKYTESKAKKCSQNDGINRNGWVIRMLNVFARGVAGAHMSWNSWRAMD